MSRPRAYYNEIDPYAAQWIRNLITFGWLTDGDVDERDIRDVHPRDLDGYQRCHFFAGIGVWEHALELAQWPADRPVWTGSCPCQPFSAAGKRGGVSDERHLWPAFFHLIEQCRPATVLGEQVASRDGLDWLDLVQADLEGAHYDVGAVDLCAAGVGAPHIRQRLWFVANARSEGRGQVGSLIRGGREGSRAEGLDERPLHGSAGLVADADSRQRDWVSGGEECQRDRASAGRIEGDRQPERGGAARGMGDTTDARQRRTEDTRADRNDPCPLPSGGQRQSGVFEPERACRLSGPWSDADWIPCRDGKARPIEPGTFPLAHGAPARVGRLRAYGIAICAPTAAAFIEAALACLP